MYKFLVFYLFGPYFPSVFPSFFPSFASKNHSFPLFLPLPGGYFKTPAKTFTCGEIDGKDPPFCVFHHAKKLTSLSVKKRERSDLIAFFFRG